MSRKPAKRPVSSKPSKTPWQDRPTVPLPEAAQILGIGRGTAYEAAKAGDIPVLTFGRRKVVPTAALKRMLKLEPAATA